MYSQNQEETHILQHFGASLGNFLELGAFDGIRYSNVRALTERGWGGVMVEASPTVFNRLEVNYAPFTNSLSRERKIYLHNIAVGAVTSLEMPFYDNQEAVGTLHQYETQRWHGTQVFDPIKVPCIDIEVFLLCHPVKKFEFVNIDIEGEDLNVVRKINFSKLGTRMVCVEWNGKDKDAYRAAIEMYGMSIIHENGENLIFAK